ncbi:MAG: DEAD/DEAH box helicase [Desulfocapsaceae bacterium]|nr:DEAD/DEAH box helicase [Desulfocapsaceae bacterium]
MTYRMKRLAGSAVSHFNRLTRSGKAVCRRMLAFSRKKEVTAVRDDERLQQEQGAPLLAEPIENAERSPGTGEHSGEKPVEKKKKKDWSLADFQVVPVPGCSRFHDFEIDLRVMRGVASQKFQYCTPIQEKALPVVLNSQDLVARAQTGTGKTAVFLVGLYCRLLNDQKTWPPKGHPRALIIAPTRELVIQIAKDGKKLGSFTPLNICAVYGGAEYRKQQEMVSGQRCDIIVATPGRLLDFIRKRIIFFDSCTTLVIDEADRMLDMGFIPDVRRILGHLPPREQRQTLLFSATITDDVRRLASQWCRAPVSIEAGEETIDVERIDQRVYLTTEKEKFILLYNLAKKTDGGRILVFANMKSEAADLVARLQAHGVSCQLLTGDVQQYKRTKRLESFRSGKNLLLVATDVAGRGIHIDDIKYVVNYTLPYEPEDYVHRIGRTGRAGADGIAISFACETGSFYLPAIEEFINRKLECVIPEDDLLVEPPEPAPIAARGGKRKYSGRRRNPSRKRR